MSAIDCPNAFGVEGQLEHQRAGSGPGRTGTSRVSGRRARSAPRAFRSPGSRGPAAGRRSGPRPARAERGGMRRASAPRSSSRGGVVMILPSRTPSDIMAAVSSQSRPAASARQSVAGQPGVQPLPEQQFGPVDVPDAGNHLLVHQQGRQRRALARPRSGGEGVPVAGKVPQRVGAEPGQHGRRFRFGDRLAGGGAAQVGPAVGAGQPDADGADRRGRARVAAAGSAASAVVVDFPLPHLPGRADAGRAAEVASPPKSQAP